MEHVHWETDQSEDGVSAVSSWGTAVPKRWRHVNRMYLLMLSPVLSGQVDFQLLQFNFLWPKRQVCHEPGTLHITQRMMWGERKELMLMRFGANLSCPKESGYLNRALRNSCIKKGIKNWPVNVLRAKAQCKCIDATETLNHYNVVFSKGDGFTRSSLWLILHYLEGLGFLGLKASTWI